MIYFVLTPSNHIKIGSTDKLKQRLGQLTFRFGKPLILLGVKEGGREEEKAIHDRFKHHRIDRRELFAAATEIAAFIGIELPERPKPEHDADDDNKWRRMRHRNKRTQRIF